jgi:two-component system cell cycle sensor histidine kinase/response regulator CckA
MQNTNRVTSFRSADKESDLALELMQTKRRLELFKNISVQINSGIPVQDIIKQALAEIQSSFPEFRIAYWEASGRSGEIKAVHCVGTGDLPTFPGFNAELGAATELAEKMRTGQPIVIGNVESHPLTELVRKVFSTNGSRAVVIVPVMKPGDKPAYVSYGSAEARQWSDYELSVLTDMAEYLAIAVRHAHAQEDRLKIEDQLRESQKMEAVGRLVGGIAHDFNNLLTAMMIYCGLLSSALGKTHRLHGHVNEIRLAGERGANLVAQLLALTKQQLLEQKILSINTVVTGMSDMLQRMIGEDVVLLTSSVHDLKTTRVDPAQLEQVILNMAINARDAMPLGGQLVIECANVFLDTRQAEEQELSPGEYVQLRVSDTGHGMDAETRSHVFEPFFTTKEQGKGTGSGLATAYGIVRQHGGNISVVSEMGKGTSFRVLLPSVDGENQSAEKESDEEQEKTRDLETLLLVEDEDMVRRSVVEILRMSGYQVLEASGGVQALEISDGYQGEIPLMITDLVMPGMNGRQVADRMAERRPQTAVLFMSGYTDDPRTRKMLGEGVDFFKKPFSPGALIEKIREILDREKKPAKNGSVAMFPARAT